MSFGNVPRDFSVSSLSVLRSTAAKSINGLFSADIRTVGALLQSERSPDVWVTAPVVTVPATQLGNKITVPTATSNVGIQGSVSANADGSVFGITYRAPASLAAILKNNFGSLTQTPLSIPGDAIGPIIGQTNIAISYIGDLALFVSPNDNGNIGAVWPYVEGPTDTWTIGAKIVPSNNIGACILNPISISEDASLFVVGGTGDNAENGAAWVFARTGASWTQQAKLTAPATALNESFFGSAVAISADGSTIVCGSPDINGFVKRGGAYIFVKVGSNWLQQGGVLFSTFPSPQSFQGGSVSISGDGNIMTLGAYNDPNLVGSLTVFNRSGTGNNPWTQGQTLVPRNVVASPPDGAGVGTGVISKDGQCIAVSGIANNGDQGAIWIFTQGPPGVWTQNGPGFTGSGAVGSANQGTALSISANGKILIEGGPQDDTGIGALWIFV